MPFGSRREQFFVYFSVLVIVGLLGSTLLNGVLRFDFSLLTQASRRLWQGEAVYLLSDGSEHTKGPLLNLLLLPIAFLPHFWVERVWDLINLGAFVALPFLLIKGPFARLAKIRPTWVWVVIALSFTLNAHNEEFGFGQYNVLGMLALVWAATKGGWSGGLALGIALLLKPTNFIFLPWVFYEQSRRVWPLLISSALFIALLSGTYAALFGAGRLVQDHLEWLRFLAPSCAKHLHESLGLPSFFAQGPWAEKVTMVFSLLAFFMALLSLLAFPAREALALTALFSFLFSPMAWRQNFVVFVPVVFTLFEKLCYPSEHTRTARRIAWVALVSLYIGTQVLNPTFIGRNGYAYLYERHLHLIIASGLTFAILLAAHFSFSRSAQRR